MQNLYLLGAGAPRRSTLKVLVIAVWADCWPDKFEAALVLSNLARCIFALLILPFSQVIY